MAGWYIRRGEKIVGPVELPKLQELVAAGRLLPTDQLAKDVAGPWKEASSTTLFAKPKPAATPVSEPPPHTSLVTKPESLPAVIVEESQGNKALGQALKVTHIVFGGVGRGVLATWGAVSRSMATRSQRKHEIKLAKIQAEGIARSQQPPAPQPKARPPQVAAPQPAVFAPQIHQTTVVQVVNKNKQSAYGCSGCGVLILLIIIIIFIIAATSKP